MTLKNAARTIMLIALAVILTILTVACDDYSDDYDSLWGDVYSKSDYNSGSSSSSSKYDRTGAKLPDPYYFFNEALRHTESTTSDWKVAYSIDYESRFAGHEYVSIVNNSRFDLSRRETFVEINPTTQNRSIYYVYDYIGSEETYTTSLLTKENVRFVEASVVVWVLESERSGKCDLYIYYGDGFTFIDSGDRCSNRDVKDRCSAGEGVLGPVGSGGGSGSGGYGGGYSGSYGGSYGGSSGHWEWRDKKVDCPSCANGWCPLCHGTGVYRLYGQSTSCPTKCSACDGLGYFIQQEYVYVID